MSLWTWLFGPPKPPEKWIRTGEERWVKTEEGAEDDEWTFKREQREVYSGRRRWRSAVVDSFMDSCAYTTTFVRARWFPKDVNPNDPLVDPEIPDGYK